MIRGLRSANKQQLISAERCAVTFPRCRNGGGSEKLEASPESVTALQYPKSIAVFKEHFLYQDAAKVNTSERKGSLPSCLRAAPGRLLKVFLTAEAITCGKRPEYLERSSEFPGSSGMLTKVLSFASSSFAESSA